ncbi:hypothetical protein [Micromonospora sp. NPDC049204]|uniref:hypothetical protein n=1 Tax=unclassified Micromonospora TaxID=2617518 RepID=UPI0033F37C0B
MRAEPVTWLLSRHPALPAGGHAIVLAEPLIGSPGDDAAPRARGVLPPSRNQPRRSRT